MKILKLRKLFINSFLIIVLFVLVFIISSIDIFRVKGDSMYPTLLSRSLILSIKDYCIKEYGLGNIVIYRINHFRVLEMSSKYIKRIVGLPNNKLFFYCLNGETKYSLHELEEYTTKEMVIPYKGMFINRDDMCYYRLFLDTDDITWFCNDIAIVLGDYYFVEGDNKDNSIDSRVFGPIPRNSIIGKERYNWQSSPNQQHSKVGFTEI